MCCTLCKTAGLLHSAINPTCGDVEYLAVFNSANVVTEKAIPALLKMPQATGRLHVRVARTVGGACLW